MKIRKFLYLLLICALHSGLSAAEQAAAAPEEATPARTDEIMKLTLRCLHPLDGDQAPQNPYFYKSVNTWQKWGPADWKFTIKSSKQQRKEDEARSTQLGCKMYTTYPQRKELIAGCMNSQLNQIALCDTILQRREHILNSISAGCSIIAGAYAGTLAYAGQLTKLSREIRLPGSIAAGIGAGCLFGSCLSWLLNKRYVATEKRLLHEQGDYLPISLKNISFIKNSPNPYKDDNLNNQYHRQACICSLIDKQYGRARDNYWRQNKYARTVFQNMKKEVDYGNLSEKTPEIMHVELTSLHPCQDNRFLPSVRQEWQQQTASIEIKSRKQQMEEAQNPENLSCIKGLVVENFPKRTDQVANLLKNELNQCASLGGIVQNRERVLGYLSRGCAIITGACAATLAYTHALTEASQKVRLPGAIAAGLGIGSAIGGLASWLTDKWYVSRARQLLYAHGKYLPTWLQGIHFIKNSSTKPKTDEDKRKSVCEIIDRDNGAWKRNSYVCEVFGNIKNKINYF